MRGIRFVARVLPIVLLWFSVVSAGEIGRSVPNFHDGEWRPIAGMEKRPHTVTIHNDKGKVDVEWGKASSYFLSERTSRAQKWYQGYETFLLWDTDHPILQEWSELVPLGSPKPSVHYQRLCTRTTCTKPFSSAKIKKRLMVDIDEKFRVIGLNVDFFEVKNPRSILASQYFRNPHMPNQQLWKRIPVPW